MYGLVNLAIEELVIKVAGPKVWESVKADVGFSDGQFILMESYPDELTYKLVGSASKHLDMAPHDVLRAFGNHWIKFTAAEGYGELIQSSADNLIECLEGLDRMHARFEATVDGLNLPSFELEQKEGAGEYWLHYYSDREGLAPMVLGLIDGLSEMFNEPCSIHHLEEDSKGTDHEIFHLQLNAA